MACILKSDHQREGCREGWVGGGSVNEKAELELSRKDQQALGQ